MMHRDSTASSSVSASAAGTPLKGMNAPSALLMAGGGDDASTNNQLAKLMKQLLLSINIQFSISF